MCPAEVKSFLSGIGYLELLRNCEASFKAMSKSLHPWYRLKAIMGSSQTF